MAVVVRTEVDRCDLYLCRAVFDVGLQLAGLVLEAFDHRLVGGLGGVS